MIQRALKQHSRLMLAISILLLLAVYSIRPLISNLSSQSSPSKSAPAIEPVSQEVAVEPEKVTTSQLFSLVNEERTKANLPAFVESQGLDASAMDKCIDMQQKDYFAHKAPDGSSWTLFVKNHVTYHKAGENLAEDFTNANLLVSRWMASKEHAENILNPLFTEVGYATCESKDGTSLIVQHLRKP